MKENFYGFRQTEESLTAAAEITFMIGTNDNDATFREET